MANPSISREYFELASFRKMPNPFPLDAESLSFTGSINSTWGELHAPNPFLLAERLNFIDQKIESGALRVGLFGSFYRGLYVLDSLLKLDSHPKNISILTGLCTDGVDVSNAKVSMAKRVWQYIPEESREGFVSQLMSMALRSGVPVYTGEVKSKTFSSDIYPDIFKPDISIMATFGQLIDSKIFSHPRLGMYNLHPSDLAQGKYPGPNPFYDMIQAGELTTRMTVHLVNDGFDTGQVVGFSPQICIQFAEPDKWNIAEKIIALHQRTSMVAGNMAARLLFEAKEQGNIVQSLDFEEFLLEECLTAETIELLKSPILGQPIDHIPHPVCMHV